MFCKHKWEVKVDKTHQSQLEKIQGSGIEMESMPSSMAQGTHVVIMACTKCGKVDKTVTKI